mmetsp:Transcript_23179/g.22662  ORF Transcript_23179/g.22662 Transcript_23179/m.22662 type:complete len:160 (-) Transcript_23179:1764-2243(-)
MDQKGEFIKILFQQHRPDHLEDSSSSSSSSSLAMSIPLNNVNLNTVGCRKHFIHEDSQEEMAGDSEFYVYGVQFLHMKKILTLRTPYLFVNKTLFSYDIHVRNRHHSTFTRLEPGDTLPLPQSLDNAKFQIRIAPEIEQDDVIYEEEENISPTTQRFQM